MSKDTTITHIGERTTFNLKILVPFVSALVFFVLGWANIRNDIKEVKDKLDSLWTASHMEVWAARLGRDNPTLNVPEPSSVRRHAESYPPNYVHATGN